MKKSALEQKWQIFIGHAKKRGATEDELKILVKAMDLIKKYSPIYKKESEQGLFLFTRNLQVILWRNS